MGHPRSRAAFAAVSAAAGACAAAAVLSALSVMSVATAPSARADDPYADILSDVQAELAAGQTAFSQAAADFASNDPTDGLAKLFIGLDDDLVGVPDDLQVGTTDALSNVPVIPASDFEFSFATPTTLAGATTEAQTFYTEGVALATTIAGLLPTDYADIALDNALSSADQWILPGQIVDIGTFISSGL